MHIELDITKENALLVSDNDTNRYIMGIGDTDYTIHRDADDIRHMYTKDGGSFYRNFSITDVHNYHVFNARLTTILGDIKWKKTIELEGKQYKVNKAYMGIEGRIKLIFHKADHFNRDRFTCKGEDIKTLEDPIKFVLDLTPIES